MNYQYWELLKHSFHCFPVAQPTNGIRALKVQVIWCWLVGETIPFKWSIC